MKAKFVILFTTIAVCLADIGEKLRLGQSIKGAPRNDFNAGLQAPTSTNAFGDNKAEATSHSEDDENNLERLCNDPFHSFLCEPVGPRKNRIDGRLRPGAQIPPNIFSSSESRQIPLKSGEAQLAAAYQPSPSFNQPNFLNQQFGASNAGPSNQYLPSKFDAVPPRQDNVPLIAPQLSTTTSPQITFSTTPAPPVVQPIDVRIGSASNTNLSPPRPAVSQQTFFRRLPTQPPILPIQTFRTTLNPPTQTIFSTTPPPTTPSNRYLPVDEQIDIRLSPAGTNLSPLLQGEAQLSEGIRPNNTPRKNPVPLRQGQANLAEGIDGKPRKEERHHTLEELCNDAFHSFLCTPITQPRRRIDGRIRPGAKIPPHVLQGAGTAGANAQQLPPQQKTGTALLAEGIQGYYYPKPQNIPAFAFEATNQSPIQNFLIPKQKVTPDKVPERIPPPKSQTLNTNPISNQIFVQNAKPQNIPALSFQDTNQLINQQEISPIPTSNQVIFQNSQPQNIASFSFQATNQLLTQQQEFLPLPRSNQIIVQNAKPQNIPFTFQTTIQPPVQNFLIQNQKVTENKIPERVPPPKFQTQNIIPTSNQIFVQNTKPQNQEILPVYQPQNLYSINYQTPVQPIVSNPIPVQTVQQSVVSNINPLVPTTPCIHSNFEILPLSNPAPVVFQNPVAESAQISAQSEPFFIGNQITQDGYQYSRPQQTFTYPTTTQKPITTTNLLYIPPQISTTTPRPTTTEGYDYPKPSSPFTLPTEIEKVSQTAIPSNNQQIIVTTPKPLVKNEGYDYPKPAQPFTIPTPRPTFNGYTYPSPANPFTLPARSQLSRAQVNNLLVPVQIINEQFQLPANNIISEDANIDDPLPPASQFEILKP